MMLVAACLFLGACSEEELDEKSIFDNPQVELKAFDIWLLENYTYPYNIEFKYKLEDIETSKEYNLAPARVRESLALAKLVKHLWVDSYNEVAGIAFTRTYVPRIIQLVGSAGWNNNGTRVLGTAEGGLKITLFEVNELDPTNLADLNYFYFKTMHHEFAHILHQTKNYDPYFQRISEADYISGDWYMFARREDDPVAAANRLGFVTRYSMSEPNDDFVEIIAVYVTSTPAEWANLLANAETPFIPDRDSELDPDPNPKGRRIIEEKFEIVRNYLKDSWGIDIDQLRDVVQRRTTEIDLLDLYNI